jgi:AcrR family transcriptional regulator
VTTAISERRESPARRRVLDAATALFYGEGVHAVGIDRIIAEAGVAKATFYSHFPAKDDLVRAYLDERHQLLRQAVATLHLTRRSPRAAIEEIFTYLAETGASPAFRGCPFINCAAEYPDPAHPVRQAVDAQRTWMRATFRDLLAEAGDPDPDRTAGVLMLLRDGLIVGSDLDDPAVARAATREAVARILG